jgi:hypothetical protein
MKRFIPSFIIICSFWSLANSCTKDRIIEPIIIQETPNNPNSTEVISINEFLAMGSTLSSDVGVASDWIELYNKSNSSFTLNAGEWFISDTPSDLEKFELPQKTIAAGGFLMLFCDDDGVNIIPPNSPFIHLNFGLSSTAGESVVLSHKVDGVTTIVDQKDFPAQTDANMSNARIPNGIGNWSYPVTPTPGASNE